MHGHDRMAEARIVAVPKHALHDRGQKCQCRSTHSSLYPFHRVVEHGLGLINQIKVVIHSLTRVIKD
jgi:hypothetical protein